MKTLFAALLLAFAGSASAASVAMKPPVGITGNPAMSTGWSTASNFVGNFSAASFSGGFTTNVGGKAVTMPATMRMAANAGRFAATAVRLNPTALVGSAVAAWLLSQGLEWIEGQGWQARESSSLPNIPVATTVPASCSIPIGGDVIVGNIQYHRFDCQPNVANAPAGWETSGFCNSGIPARCNWYGYPIGQRVINQCPTGYSLQGTACVPDLATRPATQADWDNLAASPLPDAAAGELAADGVALPMENPVFDPAYVDEPLGEPYVDPVTGKRYQDNVRVTPQSDGKTADVQTNKQEVDEEGDPVTDPTTGVEAPPEKQDDFCKQNPNAIACVEKGETEPVDLETRSVGSMVSPVAVGGAGHCMANKTLSLASMGGSVTFSYKPICDLASMVRPLILALAWLLAGWIMVGAVKES